MDSDKDKKTEAPSKRKLKRARDKGQVAVSRELAGAVGLIAGCLALAVGGKMYAAELLDFAGNCFGSEGVGAWRAGIRVVVEIVAWVGGLAAAASGFTLAVQAGLRLRPKLDLSRLNPVKGLKQMFSRQRFVDLIIMLAKLATVAVVAVVCAAGPLAGFFARWSGDLETGIGSAMEIMMSTLGGLCLVILLSGAVDRWIQRRRHHVRMRMTRKEVLDERKEQQGDPQLRSERKRLHRQLINGVGLANLRRASVVVVNPTHVAAALGYRSGEDQAPWVVVTGRGQAAKRIRQAAVRLGIPMVQHVPLARALVSLEPGEEIPEELYQAAADVIRAIQGSATPT